MSEKRQRKIIISAAVTGGVHTPTMSPYLPSTPDAIIQDAVNAAKAGAAIVHIHARDDSGKPTADAATFERILSSIKKQSNVIIGITTGGAQGMTVEERFSVITRFSPEMASASSAPSTSASPASPRGGVVQPEWERPFIERTYDNVFRTRSGTSSTASPR